MKQEAVVAEELVLVEDLLVDSFVSGLAVISYFVFLLFVEVVGSILLGW